VSNPLVNGTARVGWNGTFLPKKETIAEAQKDKVPLKRAALEASPPSAVIGSLVDLSSRS
jgi:hypothetical protein